MDKMKAIYFDSHGDISKLKHGYVQKPRPGKNEVLVKVKACALNHLDLWTLMGVPGVKIPLPHILGCDIAGEVVELGHRVSGITKNKPVIVAPGFSHRKSPYFNTEWDSLNDDYKILGLHANGGFAEYVKVPKENIIPVDDTLTFEEWASVPLAFLTAWHIIVTRGEIKKREKVLIHSGGSGIGSAAIQIARYMRARVITTVSTEEKAKRARALGANDVINYKKKDFSAEILKMTGGKGIDMVMDHIGPDTLTQNLLCLKKKGRLICCGMTSGRSLSVDVRFLYSRQISIIGAYMGGLKEMKKVISLFKNKTLRPVVDKVFPLKDAGLALKRMQSRKNFGKIVLTP